MHREVSMHESRPEHHDIVKQYRKGLTAVVDRCVVYTYPTIGTTVSSEKFYLLLFWSRLVHDDLAMHATLAALGTLPRSVSPWARSVTCKPCPTVLVPHSTVH